ncbi:hypothetical protein GGR57DRAFT_483260 [Xylariaceae sp. FL1272]|nr:hypothetical protein GGR57DRAFT_483260 [Xylariaceae sp. FL1272]
MSLTLVLAPSLPLPSAFPCRALGCSENMRFSLPVACATGRELTGSSLILGDQSPLYYQPALISTTENCAMNFQRSLETRFNDERRYQPTQTPRELSSRNLHLRR